MYELAISWDRPADKDYKVYTVQKLLQLILMMQKHCAAEHTIKKRDNLSYDHIWFLLRLCSLSHRLIAKFPGILHRKTGLICWKIIIKIDTLYILRMYAYFT